MHLSYILPFLILNYLQNSTGQNFFSKAKLHPKCKPIGPTNNLDMEWAMSMFAGKTFYLTMGSVSAYEDLSELLSGLKASSDDELNKMCAQVKIKAFKSTIEGYDGHYIVVDCAMIKKGMQECKVNSKTEFPARHKSANAIQTLAWTDNKANIILVRCTPDGKKNDWLLYSTNTTISQETKDIVKDKMNSFGFQSTDDSINKKHIRHANYNSCKFLSDSDYE